MPPPDPWVFGWTQLLTVIGFILTGGIAVAGFKTFEKWKREKLEEKRIEVALEALALGYEAAFIFDGIRSPMSFDAEWADLKGDEEERRRAGHFFAILKRIEVNRDFFDRAWKLQPRFMAVFGKETSTIFLKMQQARRSVEVSASMLMRAAFRNEPYQDQNFRQKLEDDIWNTGKADDPIKQLVAEFERGIEGHCFPIVRRKYKAA